MMNSIDLHYIYIYKDHSAIVLRKYKLSLVLKYIYIKLIIMTKLRVNNLSIITILKL